MDDSVYRDEVRAHFRKLADFAGEFTQRYPDHELVQVMLMNRWRHLSEFGGVGGLEPKVAQREIEQWLQSGGKPDPRFETLFRHVRAHIPMSVFQVEWMERTPEQKQAATSPDLAPVFAAAQEIADQGDVDFAGTMLIMTARWLQQEQLPNAAADVLVQVVERWPLSESAKTAKGIQARVAGLVGKPFELKFTDVATGQQVDVLKDFEGKVVVVDFWATWCGPCVAEMPALMELYERYKDRGVAFIGVSLDVPEAQGGKQKLLDFIAKQNVPWPQYYQGEGKELSTSWGVDAIPAHFVLDKHGRIHTTSARTIEELEKVIEQLLRS